MGLVFANVPQAQAIRWAVEVSSKIFDCVDVMAYGIFRKVTTLEFFQHHFAKSGHGDGLLMTRQLISTFRQPPLHYLTRSVRRTSGFVLADHTSIDTDSKSVFSGRMGIPRDLARQKNLIPHCLLGLSSKGLSRSQEIEHGRQCQPD